MAAPPGLNKVPQLFERFFVFLVSYTTMLFKGLNGFISLLFTAGTILLLFFIILGGIKGTGVTSHLYYFRAVTSSIVPSTPGVTQWSFWGVCFYSGDNASHPGDNVGCSPHHPAFGFDLGNNLGTSDVPDSFRRRHNSLYYLSRFLFPFFVIGLFFEVVKLFVFPFQYKSKIVSLTAYISNVVSFLFVTTAAALVTALNVKARTAFHEAGEQSVHLGRIVIAFAWTCVFMIMCQFVLLCYVRPARNSGGVASGAAYSSGGYAAASNKKSRYRFGLGSKKTTETVVVPADNTSINEAAERSSYVRA